AVVLSEKPGITTESENMEPALLDELLLNISSLSSIYHKSPQTFIHHCKPHYLIQSPVLNRRYSRKTQDLFDTDFDKYINDIGIIETNPYNVDVAKID
ncbi:15933_t:CDS:2, partial [Entrophospora sp. SA101]